MTTNESEGVQGVGERYFVEIGCTTREVTRDLYDLLTPDATLRKWTQPALATGEPELDRKTDAARESAVVAAWWRGQDAGVEGVVRSLHALLDRGKHLGTFGNPELERLAQRIAALLVRSEPASGEKDE